MLINNDCLEALKDIPDNSIDSLVTDPPYGWKFMGKKWDYDIPSIEVWQECLRVLKPGAHALVCCGTRTQHRMAVNLEDAGFEIRNLIAWVYGSGFPKSLNIGKAIDKIQGNEREITGKDKSGSNRNCMAGDFTGGEYNITKGTSEWEGWGTALKPSMELWTLCRKPLIGTVANNVLKYGTGGINIDGCRVDYQSDYDKSQATPQGKCTSNIAKGGRPDLDNEGRYDFERPEQKGRFPANLIHDGSDEVVGLFPETGNGNNGKPYNYQGKTYQVNGFIESNSPQAPSNFNDTGSAARFFKTCQPDLYLTPKHDTMSAWKNMYADTAESLLKTIQATTENTALWNVVGLPEEQNDLLVKSAVSHADTCEILTALVLAGIKTLASNQEALQVIRDSIGNYKECILLLNLAWNVASQENTDITQITTSLMKSFGFANHATIESTNETIRSEPRQLIYAPKASKSERNMGCEGLAEREVFRAGHGNLESDDVTTRFRTNMKNHHPTVKPLALMRYLCKLITPPHGMVLDPYMGSGSTGIACKLEGFDFTGIEIDPEYIKIAEARINSVNQAVLV